MKYSMHYDSLNISKEWFEIGLSRGSGEEPSEVAFRFIAYWIAFNGFYGSESNGDFKEYEEIEQFIVSKKNQLSGLFNFDNDTELQVFRDNPVFKKTNRPQNGIDYHNTKNRNRNIQRYQTFIDSTKSENERLSALVMTIYQVRCNMFHGSKTPEPDRDYELVNASQWVLKIILKKLING